MPVASIIIIILFVPIFITILIVSERSKYKNSPLCNWCKRRHYGRCIYNPKSGRFFANTNDGFFDYNDPNK